MIEISKIVEIRVKQQESEFQKINSTHLPRGADRLGESKRSTSKLKSDGKLMSLLMPELLGISEESPKWDERLVEYFGSLTVYIQNTLKLEVGHLYSINDPNREEDIKLLQKDNKLINSDESLANYVESNIPYERRILYGRPINSYDYLVYRIALEHGHVANNIKDVDASPRIRFYLYTDEEKAIQLKEEAESKRNLIKAQSIILSDDTVLSDVLWAYNLVKPNGNADKYKDDEKVIAIDRISKENPSWILSISTDKNLPLKAKIAKYIATGILYQLPGSDVITDGVNKDVTLGNQMIDVIRYFKDSSNTQVVNAYEMKYKSLIGKIDK